MVDLLQRTDHCTPPQMIPPPAAVGWIEGPLVLADSQEMGVWEEGYLKLETRMRPEVIETTTTTTQDKGTVDADHVQNTTKTSEGTLTGLLNSSNKTHERKLRGELEEGGGWRRGYKHIKVEFSPQHAPLKVDR